MRSCHGKLKHPFTRRTLLRASQTTVLRNMDRLPNGALTVFNQELQT
jgi:hypothetical protein